MLFHRADFLVFFVVVFAGYCLLGHRAQNRWLLFASYAFYSMWDWRFSGLMLLTTLVDYLAGWGMSARPERRRLWLLASLASNLGVLGLFKYCNFFADSLVRLASAVGWSVSLPTLRIVLPVGISFYTFQSISYAIDVYRGVVKAHCPSPGPRSTGSLSSVWDTFADFALYVSFFPQLVAGPIERSKHLLGQVLRPRTVTLDGLRDGCWLFTLGLLMKVAIADPVGHYVDRVYSNPSAYDFVSLYVATLAFAIQIYCDFGGYSSMARGLAQMLGFELMVNFRQPYLAASFADLWRRWHISFSTWIRDYLFLPLSRALLRMHPSAQGAERVRSLALLVTVVLSGLWHGASWAFAAWGALHGAFLAVERALGLHAPERWRSSLLRLAYGIVVFHGVLAGWFLFRVGDLVAVSAHLGRLLTASYGPLATALPLEVADQLPVLCFALLYALYDLPSWRADRVLFARDFRAPHRLALYALAALMLLSAGGQTDDPFIYFQF
jgi:D-alanyl-lipoteichoic acid acyltransferase DltB (MBOAT superfamily)